MAYPVGTSNTGTPIRVLCLGDSLTNGYPAARPYAARLRQRLEAAFPPATHAVRVEADGVPGDTVIQGSFAERARRCWARDGPFDWVIVLGGTNDLGWGYPSDAILDALKEVWDFFFSKGAKVLALTVPEIRAQTDELLERRGALNTAITEYKRQNYYTFDLCTALPYFMPPVDRVKYWNHLDGVHLTGAGYDLMGDKIADCLVRILQLEEAQATDISSIVTDAKQRRLIEEMIFEEERGNPKLLSQGYIVVRKRDLD